MARGLASLLTPSDALEPAQLETAFRGLPFVTLVLFLTAVMGSYPYLVRDPGWSVAVWLAVFFAIGAVRVVAGWVYLRRLPGKERLAPWYGFAAVTSLLHASMWGFGALLAFPQGEPAAETVLHLAVAAVAMGTAATALRLPGSFPVLAMYTFCSVAPMVLRDVLIGGPYHLLMALSIALIGIYAVINARNQADAIHQLLAQQRRNAELTQALQLENDHVNEARRAAEQANAAKVRLFAAANHDLRQPLHAVGLLAQVIRGTQQVPQMHNAAMQIGQCIDSLGELVDAMLELSQLDAHRIAPQWASFRLDDVLREALVTHSPMARTKGLVLQADATDAVVHSDRRLLGRVLSNLVANAVRYTPHGRVQISVQPDGEQLRVCVRDTGVGIAAQELPRIFEEFYQVGNAARDRGQGLGLGLATVKRLSDLLGLAVSVRSTPGQGSEFCCHLPRGDAAWVQGSTPERADGAQVERRVLVIEDDAASRRAMQLLLEGWGCEVRSADGFEQALGFVAAGFEPEFVLTDLRLGSGQDGDHAVQAIRQRLGKAVPALLVTGDSATDSARRAEQAGLVVARKPIKPAQLRAFLNGAFARSE
jgi:two-component system, sensor histidine kinase